MFESIIPHEKVPAGFAEDSTWYNSAIREKPLKVPLSRLEDRLEFSLPGKIDFYGRILLQTAVMEGK